MSGVRAGESDGTGSAAARAVEAWRQSPITALVIRWLLPDVGALMDDLFAADIDKRLAPDDNGS